jgi:ribosomal protein L35
MQRLARLASGLSLASFSASDQIPVLLSLKCFSVPAAFFHADALPGLARSYGTLAFRPANRSVGLLPSALSSLRVASIAAPFASRTLVIVPTPRPSALLGLNGVTGAMRGLKTKKRQTRDRTPIKTKLKSRKSVTKRFKRVGNGKIKYWPSGRNHNSSGKNRRRLKQRRRHRYLSGTMLKKINKMMGHR